MTEMTNDERDAFLHEARIAKLATLQSDGSPTIVPVWFEWDGETASVFTSR
ncbi:MAG: pyridoxamine 5'-phosphate oxidase family protein [Tepidiformaceae bacterium]